VSPRELIAKIEALNTDSEVHGVLLLRPLPAHICEDEVRNALAPRKDIDGITDLSLTGVFTDRPLGFAPCTAQACLELLDFYGIDPAGANAVVIGRSLVVGKPVACMLLAKNATVTLTHSHTADLAAVVRAADIVIAAAGQAGLLDATFFSPAQTIIDVGINVNEAGVIVGDVDFNAADKTVASLTPVPGGVGTVTTSVLLKHVIEAAQRLC
jgi:methylenetetrahydrofolate dehydrogenase (NADP+)/methenyltetrahydrofolate cyclohydrolase